MDKKHNTITFHAPDLSTRQELPVAGGAVKADFRLRPTTFSTRRST